MPIPILRRLLLRRFRSIPQAAIELDNPTFLVGRNGAGKSNLADAFAFLADAMASPLSAVFDRRGGIGAVGNRRSPRHRPADLAISVTLMHLNGKAKRATYGFELRPKRDNDFAVMREQCVVEKESGSPDWFDRHKDEFRSNTNSMRPALESNALALPLVGGDTRFGAVLRFLANMRAYRIEPAVLRSFQDPDVGTRLRPDGRNIASVLREIGRASPTNWRRLHDLLGSIVPGAIGVEPRKHGNKVSLVFTQEWSASRRMKFEAFSVSDGTLRALGLLAAVYQPQAPSVLVIEEPEATIHPGALGAILDVLRHAGRFLQVVATTHSPDILDRDWVEDRHLRMVTWVEGETHVTRIPDHAKNALNAHLMGAGELLRAGALAAETELFANPERPTLFADDLG